MPLSFITKIKISKIIRKKHIKKDLKFLIDLSDTRKKINIIDNISEMNAPTDFVSNKANVSSNNKGTKNMRYFFSFLVNPMATGIIIIRNPAKVFG